MKKGSGMQVDATTKKGRLPGHKYQTGELAVALKANGGLVHVAARALGCDASTIFRRVHTSAILRRVLDEARAEMLDEAEAALRVAVRNREAWAVCFALKTVGKVRGYSERPDFGAGNGEPFHFSFAISKPNEATYRVEFDD
jgi:hypothetical protein